MAEIENPRVKIRSLRRFLEGGRTVEIGFNLDDRSDESYWLRFVNDGISTTLRLSREAFNAAVAMSAEIDAVKAGGTGQWVLVNLGAKETEPA